MSAVDPEATTARLVALETRLEAAFALDARLKAIDGRIDRLEQAGKSGFRDWLSAWAPYVSGLLVLGLGFLLKDSVTLALSREQNALTAAKEMRDLIRDFDTRTNSAEAEADAMALALFGRHAILPLVKRLEIGDVGPEAAHKALLVIGHDHEMACPIFLELLRDPGRNYTWQTHKSLAGLLGRSNCTKAIPTLQAYREDVIAAQKDEARRGQVAARYSAPAAFTMASASSLGDALDENLEILRRKPTP